MRNIPESVLQSKHHDFASVNKSKSLSSKLFKLKQIMNIFHVRINDLYGRILNV